MHGEGHYIGVLQKNGILDDASDKCVGGYEKPISEKSSGDFVDFERRYLKWSREGILIQFGEQLYLAPGNTPSLAKMKVLRPGLHLGTLKKNRFEPSHALALALKPEEAVHVLNYAAESREIADYINGQVLYAEGEKGWYLILADHFSIGWGKQAGGVVKNHYPKGLRK